MAKFTNLTQNFTMIPNWLINNQNVSLKAKGLFIFLASKPNNFNFSAEGLSKLNKEGITSIKNCLKELENTGLLTRKKIKDNNNRFIGIEYILTDNPPSEKADSGKPTDGKPNVGKPTDINNKDLNKKYNTTVSNESDTLLIDDKLPNSFNPIYFTIAKSYHNLFLKTKGKNRTLQNVTTKSYVDTIRKLIELDGLTIEQLVAIKLFLEDGANKVRGVDTFWAETIYSVNALRKKNDDGVFYFDMIAQKAKKWIEMDGNKARVKKAVEYVNSLKCKNQE